MIKFETNGGEEIRFNMAGDPNTLCEEMAAVVQCFTHKILSACRADDNWSGIAGTLATGFTLAVRNGLDAARKEKNA